MESMEVTYAVEVDSGAVETIEEESDEKVKRTRKYQDRNVSSAICDLCGKVFSNIYTLSAHKKQVHEGIKTFTCQLCKTKFSTKYKLQRHHLGVHSEKRDFTCPICSNAFKTRDMLVKHQRTHFQGLGPFSCVSCDEVFKFKSGLDHHVRLKHSSKPRERIEPKSESETLYDHVRLKDSSKPRERIEKKTESEILYECSLCEKVFKSLKLFEKHEQLHQAETESMVKCDKPFCQKVFSSSKELSRHKKQDHKEIVHYFCSYCQKVYKSKTNFEIHVASHDENHMDDYEYIINKSKFVVEEVHEDDDSIEKDDNGTDSSAYLQNVDESLVSKVKADKMEEQNEIIEQDVINEEDADEIEYAENTEEVEETEEPDIDCQDVVAVESQEEMSYLIDDEVEDYLIERDDGIDFYETIIAEELEPTPLSDEDVLIEEDLYADDSIEVEYLEDENAGQIKENKRISRSRKSKSGEGEQRSICDECGSSFKNLSHLKRHTQRKHRKDEYKFECDVCGTKFLLNYDLKRHMIKHSSIRNFSCEHCETKFKTELSLKNHVKAVHFPDINAMLTRSFACKFCDRAYFHQRHLDYHTRKHTGDQRYKCTLCEPEKLFFYSDAVKWHRIRHHGEAAPFNCSICKRKFIHEKSLETHEKDHQPGSLSLAVYCTICGKSVSEKRHLERHMRNHRMKEFQCDCGTFFKERHQLKKHALSCDSSKESNLTYPDPDN